MFYLKTTETCNLNCKHCFTNGTNGPKIYWDTFKVINWLYRFATQHYNKNDSVHCEFHGGEPFLVPPRQMQEVIDKTHFFYDNITWGATTNLVFKLYDEHIDLIKRSFNNRIATSWDPKIRFANNKQYELWHNNVKKLLAAGITVKLFISVTQDTINIDPKVMLRWIRRLGVHEVSFERLTHNGSANKFPDIFPKNIDQDQWFLKLYESSEKLGAREWFKNESLETIYSKFETGFTSGGTFCRDCEEKIFTINADGTIAGCPNSAPEQSFGHIDDSIKDLINRPIRLENIACERSRNPACYSCEVFEYCGGDCHQLAWQDDICGAPKSLMKQLSNKKKTIWLIKEI
jgi:radical SAM protein with 4Fe4S-binding SPASM domain